MAKELYFLSERVEASRAIEIGLVNRTVPDAELDKEALAFARRLADGPRVAFHYMKRNLNAAISAPLERVLEMEAVHMSRVRETQDAREAAKAFAEKRKPTFKGS
jgi:2-(1,2-epoxy-1,2-dihydrophenyl)acetyl-CoA isomerase